MTAAATYIRALIFQTNRLKTSPVANQESPEPSNISIASSLQYSDRQPTAAAAPLSGQPLAFAWQQHSPSALGALKALREDGPAAPPGRPATAIRRLAAEVRRAAERVRGAARRSRGSRPGRRATLPSRSGKVQTAQRLAAGPESRQAGKSGCPGHPGDSDAARGPITRLAPRPPRPGPRDRRPAGRQCRHGTRGRPPRPAESPPPPQACCREARAGDSGAGGPATASVARDLGGRRAAFPAPAAR